jgi:FixJ family two-component response regulator
MGPTNEMVSIVDDDATIGQSLSSLLRAKWETITHIYLRTGERWKPILSRRWLNWQAS